MTVLDDTIASIVPLDPAVLQMARRRQLTLAKPPGSLGRLEGLAIQIAGIRGRIELVSQPAIVVMAADHGVASEGVSAYPAAVTREMVRAFLTGGAAINAIAKTVRASLTIVDMGIAVPLELDGLLWRRIGNGTRNLGAGPAMSHAQAEAGVIAGIELSRELAAKGIDLIVPGEMGIGNTTSASCIVAAITGESAKAVTGPGTGITAKGLVRKRQVVDRALALHRAQLRDPLDILASVGGFEIAGLVGLCLGAASRRVPVVLDGFVVGAAALIAAALAPLARDYMIAGHESLEPGHAITLARLDLEPLLSLQMRLGEGSGGALAIPIVQAAVLALSTMAPLLEVELS